MDQAVTIGRLAGGLLVLAAGAMHLWLYFDYFNRVHVIGVLFLVNAGAAVVTGVMVIASARSSVTLAAIAYAAATLAAFFLSVYHGMFGYTESLRGGWQEAAGGVELAAIVVLLPVLVASLRGG